MLAHMVPQEPHTLTGESERFVMVSDLTQGGNDRGSQDALPTTVQSLSPPELSQHPAGPVGLDDREGVFAHSFKCASCQLEFVVMSWRRSRHRADNVYCPECGEVTEKMHWRACLSDSQKLVTDGTDVEIFDVVPAGRDAELIDVPKTG